MSRAIRAILRVALAAIVVAIALGAAAAPALAAPLTVGVFAPSAPFPSTSARVELANALGAALGAALGKPVIGRVYARAGDFATAVKKGEVAIALVDPAYLAIAGGNHEVLAVAIIADDKSGGAWRLVAKGSPRIGELRGKRILVPSVGGREVDFVLNVLLGGEVGRDYFARIEPAPDTASALAALGVGKADAAVVPAAGELPAGSSEVLALPAIASSVLVVYGGLTADERKAVVAAATSFAGHATIAGFRPAGADAVRAVARRFTVAGKAAPFATPTARPAIAELARGRAFEIARTPETTFVIAPRPPR